MHLVCVSSCIECEMRKEQYGFRRDRRCMGQVFSARKVCEKYVAIGKVDFEHLLVRKRHNNNGDGDACSKL